MLTAAQRLWVKVGVAVSFLVALLLAIDLVPKHEEYAPRHEQTPFDALVPAMLGVRQLAASLLWIRTDDYFHRGEYRPILRLVRLITTIDPHQIDVYATGAWHMAYNFMDKRLIPEGIKFLEEGTRNNPTVYDLFFEAGYTHMDKTKEFPAAIDWYTQAATKKTTEGKERPMYVDFQLAHAYERAGDIDRTVKQWEANLERAQQILKEKPNEFASRSNHDVAFNNLKMTKWRINDRRDLASEPVDMRFDFTWTRVAPRKLLIEGKINALDYSRVRVEFMDKEYETLLAKNGIDWCMENLSREWESVQVRGGKFRWTLDLNRDPADMERPPSEIYPLKSDEYTLTVEFNPRTQAVFIQDRYGWSGEGLTDSRYLIVDDSRMGVVDGKPRPLRLVRKTVTVKRDQVL
jgi:tetratricopeptide (TPR) repeat protein